MTSTTSTLGTKTKRVKIDEVCPPREILEKTKERRAWIAAKLAEINATPNREARKVGTGSYERISVYEVTTVEGRRRLRGHCPVCGNLHVVDGALMVLHGYNRPGDGYLIGRCPGAHETPLNVDNTLTARYFTNATARWETTKTDLAAAEARKVSALHALYDPEDESLEEGAYREKPHEPHEPSKWEPSFAEYPKKMVAYRAAMKAWAVKFPLHAEHEAAERAARNATAAEYNARKTHEHFDFLLNTSGYYGKPLTEEIVA